MSEVLVSPETIDRIVGDRGLGDSIKEKRRRDELNRCAGVEARLNRTPEELALLDAEDKLEHFKIFVNGDSECDRKDRFFAYYHLDDELHILQHDAFTKVFGIDGVSTDEPSLAQDEPLIVKVDDADNPTVAIERKLICHEGQVVGIFYRGVRLTNQ